MTNRQADADLNRWFGMHVRAELKSKGWSSRELSRRSGASASTFTRLKNRQGIALSVAARIAEALGKPLGDMIIPVTCEHCLDQPPAGFTCQSCGAGLPAVTS